MKPPWNPHRITNEFTIKSPSNSSFVGRVPTLAAGSGILDGQQRPSATLPRGRRVFRLLAGAADRENWRHHQVIGGISPWFIGFPWPWGYPSSWIVYRKCHENEDDLGVPLGQETFIYPNSLEFKNGPVLRKSKAQPAWQKCSCWAGKVLGIGGLRVSALLHQILPLCQMFCCTWICSITIWWTVWVCLFGGECIDRMR